MFRSPNVQDRIPPELIEWWNRVYAMALGIEFTTIGGGFQHDLSNTPRYATISGGRGNRASADYTAVPGGGGAYVWTPYQFAHGMMIPDQLSGDSLTNEWASHIRQFTRIQLAAETPAGATPTAVLTAAGDTPTLLLSSLWSITGKILARATADARAAVWQTTLVIRATWPGPPVILHNTTTQIYTDPDPDTTAWTVTPGISSNDLQISVSGSATSPVHWYAALDAAMLFETNISIPPP